MLQSVNWRGIHPEIEEARRQLEKFSWFKGKQDLMVTSGKDGQHGIGSLHPSGRAFDIRKGRGITLLMLRKLLGNKKFDFKEHRTHFHIEYDPHY